MKLINKISRIPLSPGVYFYKDKQGEIIYVGKAAHLRQRVRQYFQDSKYIDLKTKALVGEIKDLDWAETNSEIDALFLESEMIKRYKPKYNILLRDDKSLTYLRIDMKNDWPYLSYTRNPIDDGADYFGPYYNSWAIKKALRYLRRIFPYYTIKTNTTRSVLVNRLDRQLGLEPAGLSSGEYKQNLKQLISYIKGDRNGVINSLEKAMQKAASHQNFEQASALRDKLYSLKELQKQIVFGDKEFVDISKDIALADLTDLLLFKTIPRRIEGFDISHLSGSGVVASMVAFKNGVSSRSDYRKFKMASNFNDDFKNMAEAITRRFSSKNLSAWGKPDVVLIDGGKGQLMAASQALEEIKVDKPYLIGLAKDQEQIIVLGDKFSLSKLQSLGGSAQLSADFSVINLPTSSHVIKLLQRIRDESHRFAVNYHTSLRSRGQTNSRLDDIPGIGPKTRQKLIKYFGSLKGVSQASQLELAEIIGQSKAQKIKAELSTN